MSSERWQFSRVLARPGRERWQSILIVLAVLAVSLACTIPAPSPRPIPAATPTQAPRISKPIPAAIPSPSPLWETVSAARSLNVRQEASYRSAGIGVLYHGARVRISGECLGLWAPIQFRGGLAWVNSRYITGDVCKEE